MLDAVVRDFDQLPPRPNAGVVSYAPGAVLGPRLQRQYQLVLVHAGTVSVLVDGRERTMSPGHVGLLLPDHTELFAFDCARPTRHSWIAVSAAQLTGEERAALAQAAPCLPLTQAMDECAALARSVSLADEPERRPVLTAVARAALSLYCAEASHAATRPPGHPAVRQARAIARQRACEGLGAAELAREVGVSPEHLVRLFSRELGTTPGAYLRAERVAHAVQLLAHTGLSVAEIAHQSGFATPQHLAHCLRAATGLTPTSLRTSSWEARLQPEHASHVQVDPEA